MQATHESSFSAAAVAGPGAASAHLGTAGKAAAQAEKAAAKAANKAAKELLAAEIEAKQKVLKLLKKMSGTNDPGQKAVLQRKIDKYLAATGQIDEAAGPAAGNAAAAVAAAAVARISGGKAAKLAAAASAKPYPKHQPLAGITSVMSNTPAEQVGRLV